MSTLTLCCQWWCSQSGTTTTTGGAAPSCSWSPSRYATPDAVIARLNLTLGALVEFALNRTTGIVGLTWKATPATLTWGLTDLRDYLGFAGNLTHADTAGVRPVRGWWRPTVRTAWGQSRTRRVGDVVSPYGRVTAAGSAAKVDTGTVEAWIRRRGDAGTLAADLTAIYALADTWAAYPLAMIAPGHVEWESHALTVGWECAPEMLDAETCWLTLETMRWAG